MKYIRLNAMLWYNSYSLVQPRSDYKGQKNWKLVEKHIKYCQEKLPKWFTKHLGLKKDDFNHCLTFKGINIYTDDFIAEDGSIIRSKEYQRAIDKLDKRDLNKTLKEITIERLLRGKNSYESEGL